MKTDGQRQKERKSRFVFPLCSFLPWTQHESVIFYLCECFSPVRLGMECELKDRHPLLLLLLLLSACRNMLRSSGAIKPNRHKERGGQWWGGLNVCSHLEIDADGFWDAVFPPGLCFSQTADDWMETLFTRCELHLRLLSCTVTLQVVNTGIDSPTFQKSEISFSRCRHIPLFFTLLEVKYATVCASILPCRDFDRRREKVSLGSTSCLVWTCCDSAVLLHMEMFVCWSSRWHFGIIVISEPFPPQQLGKTWNKNKLMWKVGDSLSYLLLLFPLVPLLIPPTSSPSPLTSSPPSTTRNAFSQSKPLTYVMPFYQYFFSS